MTPKNGNQKIIEALKKIGAGLQLIRLLGRGSVGTVYECETSSGNHVAIKLMEITPMMDSLVFEGIIKAALATRSLSENVNVVKVIHAGKIDDFYFIIMDMINGGTLEKVVENKNIKFENKLHIAFQIAEIIQAIHAKGIVHKDLKPSNLLIDENNTPFLNDFYLFPPEVAQKFSSMPHGTPYYMSPEQTSGHLVTALTDVYSFGILLYELLTGAMPYLDTPKNITDMITVVNEGKIIRPSKQNKKIDNKLEAVMLKLIEKDPKQRYQNMKTVASDLKACLNKQDISIPYKTSIIDDFLRFFR
jgi:eukaryotic-like serine/threonine-protein kinase